MGSGCRQRMDLEGTPGHGQASDERSIGEEQDEEYLPDVVGGPRDIEGNGGLLEEVGQWSSSQATQLGHPAEGRG